jgi:phage shock protein A
MSRDNFNSENIAKIDRNEDIQDIARDGLIDDAEAQVKAARRRIAELRKSIRFFAKQRESGTQFPSFQK